MGTLACVLIYGASKGFIYLCLIERVHAVWGNGRRRLSSPVYLTCMALLTPLGGIATVMLVQGVRFLHNGYCIIGMSRLSSILIMSYDTFTNSLLTLLFVVPLVRSTIRSTRLRTIAVKAAIASFVGLLIEIINGFILFALDGKEMIWVCLGACAADIVANAILLYWAMEGSGASPNDRSRSVHFSTIQQTNPASGEASRSTAGTEDRQKDPIPIALGVYASHSQRQDDIFSENITITSSECVPKLERPKPILSFRGSSNGLILGQHPWGVESYSRSTCDIDRSDQTSNLVLVKMSGWSPNYRTCDASMKSPRVRRWST
ncbi:hypothetical protein OPQ81_006165 [Rhizoctonia solani]|nr:hypothetical protein OPQ81_006165 [Rhizoctonia solani]